MCIRDRTYTLPKYQLTCGIVDIMMHTLDRYFTPVEGNQMTDRIAENLLQNVIENGRIAFKDQTDYDAMSELMWCSSLSHNGITGLGGTREFAVHKLGHELSAAYDVAHGASLSCLLYTSGRASNGPMKGANVRKSVRITFEEAVFGCEKELDVVLKDPCPTCNGTGAKPGTSPETCPKCGGKGQVVYTSQSFFGTVQNVQTCPNCAGSGKVIKDKCTSCSGTGYVSSKKKIQVSIPAGIDNGQCVNP